VNVTYVYADKPHEWNSAEWRAAIPARALNRTKRHRAKLISVQEFAEQAPPATYACEDADAIILQRSLMPEAVPASYRWAWQGKPIIVDVDDGYPQITPEHPAFDFWHRGLIKGPDGQVIHRLPRPAIHDMADGLRRVKGITAPNKLILSDWLQAVGVRGAYLPNYIPVKPYLSAVKTRSPEFDRTVWLAWGGSAGHYVSFTDSNILYALARVVAKRPHVRFVMAGADMRIIHSLPLKDEQKINLHWRPYSEWPERLVNFDIGLIPLAGDFDARRSWLKPLEYSLCNVPWIASKSPAYADLSSFGVFVDNSIAGWVDAIEEMLERGADPALMKRSREWASEQDIDMNVHKITQAYEELLR